MTITFISVHIKKSPLAFPLSSAVLASAVDSDSFLKNRTKTQIMDFFLDDSISETASSIIKAGTDTAAFSVYLWNRDFIINLISELKTIKPGISVIAGGAEVTADPQFFSLNKDIDWIVNGEGEEAVIEYFTDIIVKDESGKAHKSDTKTVISSRFDIRNRKSVSDPSAYPSPIIEKRIDLGNYDGILWELSRGCPFKCSFCFESRGSSCVRKFPFERIEKELDLIKKSGIDQVFVLDPTFNIDVQRAKKILKLIKKRTPDIHFTFEARSEFIDMETAELFSDITCSVQIGLQSSSPDILKNVNRTLDPDDFYEKILLLHEAGAVYGFDIIYGLPGDSFKTFLESIDYALSMRPNHLDIFPLAVLKGTDLYEKADSFGLIYKYSDPYTVIRTPEFPEKDLEKASLTADSVDLFYNKGEAVSFLPLLLDNLDLKPSAFFLLFSDYMNKRGKTAELNISREIRNSEASEKNVINTAVFSDHYSETDKDFLQNHPVMNTIQSESGPEKEILSLQTAFVKELFLSRDMEKEGKLAADIILCLRDEAAMEENRLSGVFDMDKVFEYLESDITNFTELVFFTEITGS